LPEKELKETFPFTIATKKKIKYLGTNVTKDPFNKSYKTPMKEIEEDTQK
jgi:hypothetical protein